MRIIYREGKRLIYVDASAATREFWEEHWGRLSEKAYDLPARGYLNWLELPLTRHLPERGKILEAGCGLGQVVLALRVRGYDVEGVEWAEDAVTRVRQLRPDIPIYAGDATALEAPDATYAGVISLGVAEHRRDGPEPFIREAFRVLAPGGILVISVPHFNLLRRLRYKASLSCANGRFFQYAFSPGEFGRFLGAVGFEIVARYGYEVWGGLAEDFPPVALLERIRFVGARLPGLVNRGVWLSRMFGHMMLFVARRPTERFAGSMAAPAGDQR